MWHLDEMELRVLHLFFSSECSKMLRRERTALLLHLSVPEISECFWRPGVLLVSQRRIFSGSQELNVYTYYRFVCPSGHVQPSGAFWYLPYASIPQDMKCSLNHLTCQFLCSTL